MITSLISSGLIILGSYNNVRLDIFRKPTGRIKFWIEVFFLSVLCVIILNILTFVTIVGVEMLLGYFNTATPSWCYTIVYMIFSCLYAAGVSIYHEDISIKYAGCDPDEIKSPFKYL